MSMCGRYTLVTDPEAVRKRFQLEELPIPLQPRYNIAPSQMVPAIISRQGQRKIGMLRWGLIPSWARDEKIRNKLINARAETLTEKPSFQNLIARKRCLIPADGFYEWKQLEKGKQPMRIQLKDRGLFAFAGLYDTWSKPDGQKVHTCTIITTQPNQVVSDIHDRMPVILRPQDEDTWLDPAHEDMRFLQSLLVPYDAEMMRAYPVSSMVGNPRHDSPACVEEITTE